MVRYTRWALAVVCLTLLVTLRAPCVAPDAEVPPPFPYIPSAPRILLRNAALLLTMDPALGKGVVGLLQDSDLLIEGDTIAAVGTHLHSPGAQVVDATGKIVMPGFVDVHNHLWQSLIRGCGLGYEVGRWLQACSTPLRIDPTLTPTREETYALVRLSTLDLLDTGVTTVVDWSHAMTPEFVRGNLQALRESAMRFVYVYNGVNSETVLTDICVVKQTLLDSHPRAAGFQIGAKPTMAPAGFATFQALLALAHELDVKVNAHVLNVVDRTDRPIEALTAAGALGATLILNHAIHLTDDEIALLARHDVRATHNPLSNMRLASGIMRLADLRQAGVQVGLGSDGGTNDTSNFFDTLRAAVGLQRAVHLRTDVYPTVPDVLRLATLGGAELLDLGGQIGSLTPGKKADLIIVNPATLNFAPGLNGVNQLVFNGQPRNVEWVFVDGRPLKARGRLLGVHPEAVVAAAEAAARRIRQAWIAAGTFPE